MFRPYAPKNPHQQEQMFPKTRPDSERKNYDYTDPHTQGTEKPKKYEYPNKKVQEGVWTQPRKEQKSPHENIKAHPPIEPHGPYMVDPSDLPYKNPSKYPDPNTPKKNQEGPSKGQDDWHKPDGGSPVPRKPKTPKKPSSGGKALPIPQKVK